MLSGDAKQVLRSFYLELRRMRAAAQGVPVTVRRSSEQTLSGASQPEAACVGHSAESMPVTLMCLYQLSLGGRVAGLGGTCFLSKAAVSLHTDESLIDVQSRQLESLIRLTEARARLDLREVATKDDAEVGSDCCALATLLILYKHSQQSNPLMFRAVAKKNMAACLLRLLAVCGCKGQPTVAYKKVCSC